MKRMFSSEKPLKLGTNKASKINLGTNKVSKIYLGTNLVFGSINTDTYYFIKDGMLNSDLYIESPYMTEQGGYVSLEGSNWWYTFGGESLFAYSDEDLSKIDSLDVNFTLVMNLMGAGIESGSTYYGGSFFYSDIPIYQTSAGKPGAVIQAIDLPYVSGAFKTYSLSNIFLPYSIATGLYFGIRTGIDELRIKDLYITKKYK